MTREEEIENAKIEINKEREAYNKKMRLKKGDKGYLGQVKDFIVAEWEKGFICMVQAEYKAMKVKDRTRIFEHITGRKTRRRKGEKR